MYETKRFFCMTGTVQNGLGRPTIERRDVSTLHRRMLEKEFVFDELRKKTAPTDESAEDFRLIGEVHKQPHAVDADALERAFREKYPERYAERNRVKGDHAGMSYFRYTIERFLSRKDDEGPELYVVSDAELCAVHWQQKGRGDAKDWVRTLEPLANFDARIVKHIILDDGVTTTAAHVVRGARRNGKPLPETRVLAADFPTMGWVAREWTVYGASLRPGIGVKDKLRAGIEFLSADPALERIFTHTGWVKLETGWTFLHAGGALRGSATVDLGSSSLERYRLASDVGDQALAMRSSLALLDVGPNSITVPLWAAMFRAPLASHLPVNFTVWFDAPTGNLKTTLASLFLSHFGEFDVNHSPANWSSTANALEHQAFLLQDLPLLIDEYVPTSARDVRELEAKAARLIRAQGNLTGRARMDQSLRQRQSFPPRGLLVSTGEGRPPGESIAARCIVLEPRQSVVNLEKLTAAQRSTELLRHAMSGYIAWLAPQIDGLRAKLPEMQQVGREKMFRCFSHLRVPETIGSVRVGAEMAVEYAIASRAIRRERSRRAPRAYATRTRRDGSCAC